MKSKFTLQIFWGLVFLCILLVGFIFGARAVWINIVSLQKEVAVVIIASGTTAVVTLSTYYLGRYFEKKRDIQNQYREKKIAIYEKFIQMWFEQINPTKKAITLIEDEPAFENYLKIFTREMILWSSDNFIKKYGEFKNIALLPDQDIKVMLYKFEELLLEIRTDLNNSNKKIDKGDILKNFINDMHKYKP